MKKNGWLLKVLSAGLMCGALLTSDMIAQGAPTSMIPQQKKELIQVAILLDTSGSMSGLVEQAKSALWKMVNELALAKRNGVTPRIEVALYEYGKSSIAASEGFLRMILPLTTDLDKLSDELFKLDINGGEEYCGLVIRNAVTGLNWSADPRVLKILYIAGNEPFTQGNTDYVKSCQQAIQKGITVNTIFCGSYNEGVSTKWKHGADLADGFYINIDHNKVEPVVNAPQDDEILRLGKELNSTYLGYGYMGAKSKKLQEEQDSKAAGASKELSVQRSLAKASAPYAPAAANWDMVSAYETGAKDISKMEKEELPEELKGKSDAEIKVHVEKLAAKRKEIQSKLDILNKERRLYVENARQKDQKEDSFDSALLKSLRALAVKKNYVFE